MIPQRWLAKIEDATGARSIILPTARYEYQPEQGLVNSYVALAGVNYQYDQLRGAPSVKDNGQERVRFLLVGEADGTDVSADSLRAIAGWGRVKMWTHGSGGKRWAWGRYATMPSMGFTVGDASITLGVSLQLDRLSDWYSEVPVASVHTGLTNPQTFEIINDGNELVHNAIVIVKGTFSSLLITNNSSLIPGTATAYKLQSSRVGTLSSHWLKFDCGENTVSFSTDSGATWTDDSADYIRQAEQVSMMIFVTGPNSITIAGAAGATIEIDLSGAWY